MAKQGKATRDDFLAALQIQDATMVIPGVGEVTYRPLSHAQRQELVTRCTGKNGEMDTGQMQVLSVIAGMVDPVLTDDDVVAIQQGRPSVIDELSQRIVGAITDEDEFEKKAGNGS